MRLEISAAALADLDAIEIYGRNRFGPAQTSKYVGTIIDVFDLLSFAPLINTVQSVFGKDVRMHTLQAHIIFYRVRRDTVLIERVLSRYENWPKLRV
jgi:plasmid stabilization system protein ParE